MTSSLDPCPVASRLQQFQLGLLPVDEVDQVEQHLARCELCMDSLEQLHTADRMTEAVRDCVRAGPRIRDEWEDTLMRRIRSLAPTPVVEFFSDTIADLGDDIPAIAGYEILNLLGRGGMGVVYKARHQGLGRVVALKMLRKVAEIGHTSRLRFLAESRLIAGLRHPHIVQVFDVGEHEGRPYFSMEFLEAGTLAHRLREVPISSRQAAELIEPLARAAESAHAAGIIHRDLKPGNVLLVSPVVAKLADFGLAKNIAQAEVHQTQSGAILGTPSYMAPEQAQGGVEVGPAVDVYALGAILYECLTGRAPFLGATPFETLQMVREQDPVAPSRLQPAVPRDLETICLKCLEKSPLRRYSSAEALADDLNRYLAGEPIRARRVGGLEHFAKWVRRKPMAAALAGVSVAFVLAAVVGGTWHYSRIAEALKRAEDSEARTREQYREATATIRRMFGKTTDRRTVMIPQMRELQEAQLTAALKFFEDAVADGSPLSPEARRDLGLLSSWAANFQSNLGRYAEAERNVRRAITLLEQVIHDDPQDHEARASFAFSHIILGAICVAQRRGVDAETSLRQGIELLEEVCRDEPVNARYKSYLRQSYHNLGNLMVLTRRPAVQWYEKAVAIGKEMLRDDPADLQNRLYLADNYSDLWQAYHLAGQPKKGVAALHQAHSTLDGLAKEHPTNIRIAYSLGGVLIKLGATCLMQQRVEDALTEYTKSVAVLERALKHEPNDAGLRRFLVVAQGSKAECLTTLKRYSEARSEWEKYIALPGAMNNLDFRLTRALTLIHLGEHDKAAREVDAVAQLAKSNGPLLYNCACALALSAGAEAKRPEVAEPFAARAVALLEAARVAGHFKNKANVAHMKKDNDLDPLRGRKDYRTLVRSVE